MERLIERLLFQGRWLLVPFYLGLMLSLALLVVKFVEELVHVAPRVLQLRGAEVILAVLDFVDLSLAGNLIVLVVFSGYESFVSRMDAHVDRPEWMGKVDFSGLKLKVMGSVVAISAIHLLRAFMNIAAQSERKLQRFQAKGLGPVGTRSRSGNVPREGYALMLYAPDLLQACYFAVLCIR